MDSPSPWAPETSPRKRCTMSTTQPPKQDYHNTAVIMKHSASPGLESGRDKARRQEPISCLFCRTKKLKCDRGAPCSNCRARKVTCSSISDGKMSLNGLSADQPLVVPSQNLDDLNARVRRLEELLIRGTPLDAPVHQTRSASKASYSKKVGQLEDTEITNAVSWVEIDAFEHTASAVNDLSALDSKIIESFGSFVFSLTRPRIAPKFQHDLLALLPTRNKGEVLLEYYFDNVNWIYHVIHAPTVRTRFECLYTSIETGQTSDHSHLALIATIFALSAYFSTATSGLYFKSSDSMLYSRRWTLLAQEALSAANCLAEPNVETLQSLILISQHMMANIGAVATIRTLSATIMHTARTMSLHTLDTDRNKKLRESTVVDYVDLEVKRRLWWHIVSTDWLLSFMSGAQCGTYMIHPKQMACEYPNNVDDEHISNLGPDTYAQPAKTLTEMTYSLFRFQFSAVYREMVDAAWDIGSDIDDLPYDVVLEFDKKLNVIATDCENVYAPVRKSVLDRSLPDRERIDEQMPDAKRTSLVRQRDMMYFGLHTRFARLHRPYLVRGAQDPRYSYSRMVCLRSARTVIELGKSMVGSSKELTSIKIWFINHHVFVSTVILVMDYCFNREEPRAKERREEILDCFRLLESSRQDTSTIASRGLAKLKSMLGEKNDETKRAGVAVNTSQHFQPSVASNIQPNSNPTHTISFITNQAAPPMRQIQDANVDAYSAQYQNAPFTGMNDFNATVNSKLSMPAAEPQSEWPTYDYLSFEDINFDVDLDVSQFEALFQGIDGTAYN